MNVRWYRTWASGVSCYFVPCMKGGIRLGHLGSVVILSHVCKVVSDLDIWVQLLFCRMYERWYWTLASGVSCYFVVFLKGGIRLGHLGSVVILSHLCKVVTDLGIWVQLLFCRMYVRWYRTWASGFSCYFVVCM